MAARSRRRCRLGCRARSGGRACAGARSLQAVRLAGVLGACDVGGQLERLSPIVCDQASRSPTSGKRRSSRQGACADNPTQRLPTRHSSSPDRPPQSAVRAKVRRFCGRSQAPGELVGAAAAIEPRGFQFALDVEHANLRRVGRALRAAQGISGVIEICRTADHGHLLSDNHRTRQPPDPKRNPELAARARYCSQASGSVLYLVRVPASLGTRVPVSPRRSPPSARAGQRPGLLS
jgi:hypothetical protein